MIETYCKVSERPLKETAAYRGEFLKITCPYCGHTSYQDIEDDYAEGFIPDNGRKVKCENCGETMVVTEFFH